MNVPIGRSAACFFIATLVSACSTTQSVNVPTCGPEIEEKDVIVGDLRPFKNREKEIPAYLESHLGSYTVMSEQSVLIQKNGNRSNVFTSTGLAIFKAAKAGCNLVLVMDESGQRNTNSGSISGQMNDWVVKFGTFEPQNAYIEGPALPDP